jgi:hypothetical protein
LLACARISRWPAANNLTVEKSIDQLNRRVSKSVTVKNDWDGLNSSKSLKNSTRISHPWGDGLQHVCLLTLLKHFLLQLFFVRSA